MNALAISNEFVAAGARRDAARLFDRGLHKALALVIEHVHFIIIWPWNLFYLEILNGGPLAFGIGLFVIAARRRGGRLAVVLDLCGRRPISTAYL